VRALKGVIPMGVSLALLAAVTAILWHLKITTTRSEHLVFFYLLPAVLIAYLYTGRLAMLCAAMAVVLADYFLQDPLYSLANDNPLEYGDLICFAALAAMAIKCIRVLVRPRAEILEAGSRRRGR
jgi:K+-sensing histidine kinase KdpD